jgi:hypothetical protein
MELFSRGHIPVSTTTNLTQILYDAIENKLVNLHTSIPAEIVDYDHTTNLCTVQPLLKRKYVNNSQSTQLPIISNVPIALPRMGDAHLKFPVHKGDEGQLIFCERSIDKWINSGGLIDPEDSRKFHLSDAVFYPGLNSLNNLMKTKSDQNSLEIKNKEAFIELKENGDIKIKSNNKILIEGGHGVELLNEISKALNEIVNHIKLTKDHTHICAKPGDPTTPPITKIAFEKLKILLSNIKSTIDKIRG